MNNHIEKRSENGFTLVELLIAVALVSVMSAVAIVGLTGVTSTGNKSACSTLVESAKAAATTYYATTGAYPRTSGAAPLGFSALLAASPPVLTLPSGATGVGNVMSATNSSWSVTMTGAGGLTPNGYTKTGGGVACS